MSYYQNSYSTGDTFIDFKGNKYTVVTGGNTPSTPFDSSNIVNDKIVWGNIELEPVEEGGTGQGLVDYEANKSYSVGDIVLYDDKIYKCITAHTSTSTFDDTKWEEISSSDKGLSIWQANTAYNVDDIVIDSNLIWQCVTAHTSTSTFDESKWVCISGGEISNGLEIVPLWEGNFSFSNATNGATPTSSTPMIELNDSINNYEYLYIIGVCGSEASSTVLPVSKMVNSSYRLNIFASTSYYITTGISCYDNTHLFLYYSYNGGWPEGYITLVQGIRKSKPIVSSGMKYETLWEGEVGSLTSNSDSGVSITLQDSLRKYKKIGLYMEAGFDGGNPWPYYREISTDMYFDFVNNSSNGQLLFVNGFTQQHDYIRIDSGTDSTMVVTWYSAILTKIIGISEGVQIPTGVQAARVTLFEGVYTGTSPQLLSDSIANYDQLEFTFDAKNTSTDTNKTVFMGNVSDIEDFDVDVFRFSIYVNSNSWSSVDVLFSDLTHFYCLYWGSTSWSNPAITKIVGIKYIQPDSYSTQEKLIGTWIDGKPLYRKVFDNVVDNTNSGLTSSTATVVKLYGCVVGGDGTLSMLPNTGTELYIVHSSGVIRTTTSRVLDYVVIEYTKN